METKKPPKLIHVGLISLKDASPGYLFLKQLDPYHFAWFEPSGDNDQEPKVAAETVGTAIHQARQHWKLQYFRRHDRKSDSELFLNQIHSTR